MMELVHIPITALAQMRHAVEWQTNRAAIDAHKAGLLLYGLRPLVFNRNTGRLLTGRDEITALTELAQTGQRLAGIEWERVPVLAVNIDETDELPAALRLVGGIDYMLQPAPSAAAIDQIISRYGPDDVQQIAALGQTIHQYAAMLEEMATPDEPPVKNEWGIPTLIDEPGILPVPGHAYKWGTLARSTALPPGSLYHFYTDDEKFAGALADHSQIIAARPVSVVEINISTNAHQPRALVLWNIYGKRYISRKLQEEGIGVWVDMNTAREFDDLTLLGVPWGWTTYANRAYARDLDHLDHAYERAQQRADGAAVQYLVYGGGDRAARLCQARGWHWLPDATHEAH